MYTWRGCPKCHGTGSYLAADPTIRALVTMPCFYSVLDHRKEHKEDYEKELRQSPNVVILKDFRGGK